MTQARKGSKVRGLNRAHRLFDLLGEVLDLDVAVRLWDGSRIPLGRSVASNYEIVVSSPGVLSSLLRRPTLDNLLLHYAKGSLTFAGGDPLGFVAAINSGRGFKRLRSIPKTAAIGAALRIALARPEHAGRLIGAGESGDSGDLIRFHYDIGNEFYALFLDEEMQYSCAYFRERENDLNVAQREKLDVICQSLRLGAGDRFLDVGCGWGGLLCHAAKNYDVQAHGVTLSPAQFDYTMDKVEREGLKGQVTVELAAYEDIAGSYDKIASIEMIEHIGLGRYPAYFGKLRSVLVDRGLLLNQGTTRAAKRTARRSRHLRAGSRMMERYVFPGFELDNVGHTISALEAARFEIHHVQGWRDHYAETTRRWCLKLWENRAEAESIAGAEKTRLWLAYLASVSAAFQNGSLRVYQIVAGKHGARGPTRG